MSQKMNTLTVTSFIPTVLKSVKKRVCQKDSVIL